MATVELNPLRDRAAAIRGLVLDVDGVLSDGRLHYGPDGEFLKSFHARDGLGIVLLRETGMRLAILSGRQSPVVQRRADELGFDPCLLGRSEKLGALSEIAQAWRLDLRQLAAMGDDWVDLPMLDAVGLSAAPADAAVELRRRVDILTKAKGGRGAVREFCDFLLRCNPAWPKIATRFGLTEEI
ncbi:MAG TPA: HAD hydrolase family protein [Candidatus Krumholzibacteria bacterium]